MLTPSDAMNKHPDQGWFAKLMHFTGMLASVPGPGYKAEMQEWLGPADLIIFQRNVIVPEALDAIKYWQGMGKPVVIDLDDAYQILPWSNPAHVFWHERGRERLDILQALENGEKPPENNQHLKTLEEGLRLSNGLIAPNRNLLKSWEHCVGPRQYYLQNYAEGEWWADLPEREALKKEEGLEGKTVIGWGGSISHYDSFWGSGIFEAAARICRRYDNVVWKICGNDTRIFERLQVAGNQKMHQPGVPPQEWPRQVRSFDIGVAPLFGWYDQQRSWIKGIEYLLAGVPWVGTGGGADGTYADLAQVGRLIPNGVDAWEAALVELIEGLEGEQARARKVEAQARTRFVAEGNLDVFARVYKKIIKDFSEDVRRVRLPGVVRT